MLVSHPAAPFADFPLCRYAGTIQQTNTLPLAMARCRMYDELLLRRTGITVAIFPTRPAPAMPTCSQDGAAQDGYLEPPPACRQGSCGRSPLRAASVALMPMFDDRERAYRSRHIVDRIMARGDAEVVIEKLAGLVTAFAPDLARGSSATIGR